MEKKDVEKIFAKFGKIEETLLIVKKEKPVNYAYITFENSRDAMMAINLKYIKLDYQKALRVVYSRPKFSDSMLQKIHPALKNHIRCIQGGFKQYCPKDFVNIERNILGTGQTLYYTGLPRIFNFENSNFMGDDCNNDGNIAHKNEEIRKLYDPWYGYQTDYDYNQQITPDSNQQTTQAYDYGYYGYNYDYNNQSSPYYQKATALPEQSYEVSYQNNNLDTYAYDQKDQSNRFYDNYNYNNYSNHKNAYYEQNCYENYDKTGSFEYSEYMKDYDGVNSYHNSGDAHYDAQQNNYAYDMQYTTQNYAEDNSTMVPSNVNKNEISGDIQPQNFQYIS